MAEYRWRIRQLHPDKCSGQGTELFYEMQEAKVNCSWTTVIPSIVVVRGKANRLTSFVFEYLY